VIQPGREEASRKGSYPSLLAVLLQFSLFRSFEEPEAVDEAGMATDFEI
jgi:hypothetical protein